jgi:hypothetical protein
MTEKFVTVFDISSLPSLPNQQQSFDEILHTLEQNNYKLINEVNTIEKLVGNELYLSLLNDNTKTEKEKENLIVNYCKHAINQVNGFSDYRDCYWCASYFFELCIINMNFNVALHCVNACSLLYESIDRPERFQSDWTNATLIKGLIFINDNSNFSNINDLNKLCEIIEKISSSGDEYEEYLQSHIDYKDKLNNVILYWKDKLSELNNDKSNNKIKKQYKKLIDSLTRITSLFLSGLDKISAIEESIDISDNFSNINKKKVSKSLLNLYNVMCDEDEVALDMQLHAVHCKLTLVAIHILEKYNEDSGGEVFMEAGCWLKLLLTPWDKSNENHMKVKKTIAEELKKKGIIENLFKQISFWAIEWQGMFGDGGLAILSCWHEITKYFPIESKSFINLNNIEIVQMIRTQAAAQKSRIERNKPFRMANDYPEESNCIQLEYWIDNKDENGELINNIDVCNIEDKEIFINEEGK